MQGMPGDALPPALEARRAAVFAASAFVADSAARDPALLPGLAATGELDRPRSPGEIGALASGIPAADEAGFMDALRRLRRRELARIAWRDLAGTASFPETLAETSALADAAIVAARAFAERGLAPRYGTPRSAAGEAQELLVIGMGKLGGGELNFSSDIDLVFLFPESGETEGPRAVSNEEYFTRLGQSLIRLLDARTAEGFVYRVDMRLRPLGEPGPLAMNFAAFEGYLQQHGRDWERYAWVKARAVTGAQPVWSAVRRRRPAFRVPALPRLRRLREPARDEGDDRARGRAARAAGQRQARARRHPRDRVHRAVPAADPRRDRAGAADAVAAFGAAAPRGRKAARARDCR